MSKRAEEAVRLTTLAAKRARIAEAFLNENLDNIKHILARKNDGRHGLANGMCLDYYENKIVVTDQIRDMLRGFLNAPDFINEQARRGDDECYDEDVCCNEDVKRELLQSVFYWLGEITYWRGFASGINNMFDQIVDEHPEEIHTMNMLSMVWEDNVTEKEEDA